MVTAVADPVRESTTTVQASRYRPELDGLRAVAALLVIAFHAGMASAVGGYIGVDIFFVLSGFLITGLLINSAASGPRALVTFYARRMRRLLPAALVVLLVTSLAWSAVANSVEREPIIGDVRSAALYFSNWHFAAQATDYFASADAPSPFVHYWSLSAEEQFYLLWPALVVIVFAAFRRNPRRGRRALGWLAVVLGAASLVSLTLATRAGSEHAYFGTDTRAYQLLAGALLALWAYGRRNVAHAHAYVHVRRSQITGAALMQLLALAGLVVVASSAFDLSPTGRGLLAAAFTVALLWAFELVPRGAVGRPLSWPIPAYLGRVSYGTYLWHWPVILLLRRFADIAPHFLFAVAAVISISLASMSYRMLEEPIRRSPALSARTGLVIACGLAASVAVGLVLAPGWLSSDHRPSITPVAIARPADGSSASSASASTKPGSKPPLSGPALPPPKTHTPVPSAAALHDAAKAHAERTCLEKIARLGCLAHKGAGPRVLFVGDSHLEPFFPVLDDLAAKHDLNLYTWMYYVCPWQKDVLPDGTNAEPCKKNKAKLYDEMLRTVRPDVVVTVNRAYDDPQYSRKVFVDGHPDETDASKVLSASMPASAAAVLTYAKRLIVVEPWPSLSFNPRECLSGAKYDEECRGRASRQLASEKAIAAVAAQDFRVATVDLDDAVCPQLPVCNPVVGGVIVRIDNDHLTIAFAKAIEPAFDKRLIAAGAYGP